MRNTVNKESVPAGGAEVENGERRGEGGVGGGGALLTTDHQSTPNLDAPACRHLSGSSPPKWIFTALGRAIPFKIDTTNHSLPAEAVSSHRP